MPEAPNFPQIKSRSDSFPMGPKDDNDDDDDDDDDDGG